MNQSTSQTRVLQAASLVGTAVLVSRLVGLLRDIVIKYYLGVTSVEATAFDAANRLPETIFLIVAGGAIGSAFIPTFAGFFARNDEEGGWRLFSAVLNLLTTTLALITTITAIFAPQFVTFFLPELITKDPTLLPRTVTLMRVMLISTVIFGASGVVMSALNARQHFLMPAIAPVVYNIGIILGGMLWKPHDMGFAIGTVLGAMAHLGVQIPILRQKGAKLRFIFNVRDPGVTQVLRLTAPRVLGLSFSEVNEYITLYLSGFMPFGSLPALSLAMRLIIMPQGILGQAMGIAAFPTMADLAARHAYDELRQVMLTGLRWLCFLGIPASAGLMVLGRPFIALLLQRGLFDAQATQLVAFALFFYAIGLVPLTAIELIARAFYALNDTLTPVLAGGVQVLMMGLLSRWLTMTMSRLGYEPLGGLALGFTLSNFLELFLLWWLLRRRLGKGHGRFFLRGLIPMLFAGCAMAAVMTLSLRWSSVWMQALGGGLIGSLVYLVLSLAFRLPEMMQLVAYGRRRLGL